MLGSEIRTHNDPNQPCWSGETAQALSDWIGGGNDDGIQLTKVSKGRRCDYVGGRSYKRDNLVYEPK